MPETITATLRVLFAAGTERPVKFSAIVEHLPCSHTTKGLDISFQSPNTPVVAAVVAAFVAAVGAAVVAAVVAALDAAVDAAVVAAIDAAVVAAGVLRALETREAW